MLKYGVRILRPKEYEQLKRVMSPNERILIDGLLTTGMRWIEAERFWRAPGWLDKKFINLPEGANGKKRAEYAERTIRLSDYGQKAVPAFLNNLTTMPTRGTWDWVIKERAKSAHLDPVHLCAKTTRKTWESWLVFYFGEKVLTNVQLSQGHIAATQVKHYLGMAFYEEEKEGMAKYVDNWL